MKFCVVGPVYPFRGGIAHHTTLLCRHLGERHEVEAVTFKRLYPSILFPGKSQVDPSKSAVSYRNSAAIDSMNPLTWIAAGKAVRETKPDWVLIQWWHPFFGPCLSSIASKVGARVAFICHNVVPHESMPFARELSLRTLRHGDAFIVHSSRDAEDLRQLLPGLSASAVRQTVLPKFDLFPVSAMTRDEARVHLGIEGRMLLFFGLVRKYKGLMDLIDAMSLVRNKDVKCLVVGEFYDKPEPYTDRIDYHGLTDRFRVIDRYIPNEEVETYFAAADVVVLPYRTATQSGIVQTAFSFGRPVIATSVGGLPESIDNGKTGLLVPPGDPEGLAQAIDIYFDEGMEQRFVEGIAQDRDRFSWDRVIEAIEELTSSL